MAEVSIKAHTRRGKNGTVIKVRSYTRRVGRKGVHSPKRPKSEKPGEEFEQKMQERQQEPPKKLTPEEIAQRKEAIKGFEEVERKRKVMGMTREQYSRYIMDKNKKSKDKPTSSKEEVKPTVSEKKTRSIFDKVEDKIAKFVDKYGGGRKYKR